jgi:hypothetical protein
MLDRMLGKKDHMYIFGGNVKYCILSGNQYGISTKSKK